MSASAACIGQPACESPATVATSKVARRPGSSPCSYTSGSEATGESRNVGTPGLDSLVRRAEDRLRQLQLVSESGSSGAPSAAPTVAAAHVPAALRSLQNDGGQSLRGSLRGESEFMPISDQDPSLLRMPYSDVHGLNGMAGAPPQNGGAAGGRGGGAGCTTTCSTGAHTELQRKLASYEEALRIKHSPTDRSVDSSRLSTLDLDARVDARRRKLAQYEQALNLQGSISSDDAHEQPRAACGRARAPSTGSGRSPDTVNLTDSAILEQRRRLDNLEGRLVSADLLQ